MAIKSRNGFSGKLFCGECGWKLCRKPSGMPFEEAAEEEWEETVIPLQQPCQEETRVYARELELPRGWGGRRVFIRFEGVCCDASVYCGKVLAGTHYGGFVSWDCEITGLVHEGEKTRLSVAVRDDPGGICSFHFGGIIRDVKMFSVPACHISRLHARTAFDAE